MIKLFLTKAPKRGYAFLKGYDAVYVDPSLPRNEQVKACVSAVIWLYSEAINDSLLLESIITDLTDVLNQLD